MKTRELYKKYPLVTMVCAFAVIDLCSMSFSGRDLSVQVMGTSLAALCASGAVYLLVPSVLKPRFCPNGGHSEKEALARIAAWVIFSALAFGLATFACASVGVGFAPGVIGREEPAGVAQLVSTPADILVQRALLAFLLCAVTAIFEEGFFRGIVVPCAYERSCREIKEAQAQHAKRGSSSSHAMSASHAMSHAHERDAEASAPMASLKATRPHAAEDAAKGASSRVLPFEENPALSAALFSGILFGVIHIAGFGVAGEDAPEATTTLATVFLALQTLLKAVQAGLFGFCMAALLLTTRSLFLPVLTHALFDLLYFMLPCLATGAVAATYATGNVGDMLALILSIALLLPPCAKSAHLITHEVVPYCSFDE